MSESSTHLDESLLQGYIDNLGKQIVQQMLDLYIQQSVVYIKDLNQAVIEQSQPLWKEYAHKMKGAAGSVGLTGVHAELVVLEKLEERWNDKKQLSLDLEQLNQKAITTFIAWLSEQ